MPGIPFMILESPYRQLVQPLIRYLELVNERRPEDVVVVLLPEYVARHWWERFLYNDNGRRIRDGLLGRPNVVVANVPFRRPNGTMAQPGGPAAASASAAASRARPSPAAP